MSSEHSPTSLPLIRKRSPPYEESSLSPYLPPVPPGFDEESQRGEKKSKPKNVVWSHAMDKCLIDNLASQAMNGNKVDNCFNESAYTAACAAVNTRFDLSLNHHKAVNRLKTIRKRYKIAKAVLNREGFTWNPVTKMIECDDENLWKSYVNEHPDARVVRGRPIEMYDELKIVCESYQAPSFWARMTSNTNGNGETADRNYDQDLAPLLSPSSEGVGDAGGTESSTQHLEYIQMPGGGSLDMALAQQVREAANHTHNPEGLRDALLAVASSIRQLASSLERSKNAVDAPALLQAVMGVDGLDEEKQMHAFEYLNSDPIKARAFMAYNARLRKLYLFRQLLW